MKLRPIFLEMMNKRLFLILFFMSKIEAEDDFKNMEPFIDYFHEIPKAWNGYVKEFLFLALPQSSPDNFRTRILDVFQILQTFSTLFRKRMLYVKKLKRKRRSEEGELPEYNKAVIHSASGRFKYLYNRHVLPVVYVWTFSMDGELRLNITFNYISPLKWIIRLQ